MSNDDTEHISNEKAGRNIHLDGRSKTETERLTRLIVLRAWFDIRTPSTFRYGLSDTVTRDMSAGPEIVDAQTHARLVAALLVPCTV